MIPRSAGDDRAELLEWFAGNLRERMLARGHRLVEPTAPGAAADREDGLEDGVALHPVDVRSPRGYRRRSRAIFVVGLGVADEAPPRPLETGYPLLLRSLANLFVLVVRTGRHRAGPEAYFFTLEQGYFAVPYAGDDDSFFGAVLERVAPLATSRLVIGNEFCPDLPPELWEGDEQTAAIERAGRRLAALDLLPAPFPLQEFLSPEDFRHVLQLFGIGGLSYGNISARKDEQRFWMSASGVDKNCLRTVGRDILLVTGCDLERRAILVSVPPHVQPRRVSVDAVEHLTIYREHPAVGAILHVHAWMDGVPSTAVNYPCGTLELAQAVAGLVREAPDPTRAVVGLKNHGLTVTGPSLDEIFARVEGRILRQVPMG
ncbi:MAG: class II aldolase/adducin family protein [Chloroflexota bacterium]|nr:class II aldolase/adducin family protein [Chloroflexota bacterium]